MTPGGHTQVRSPSGNPGGSEGSIELSGKNTLERRSNQPAAVMKSSPVSVYALSILLCLVRPLGVTRSSKPDSGFVELKLNLKQKHLSSKGYTHSHTHTHTVQRRGLLLRAARQQPSHQHSSSTSSTSSPPPTHPHPGWPFLWPPRGRFYWAQTSQPRPRRRGGPGLHETRSCVDPTPLL